eukprot:2902361-Amphidinium_carterae.1
MGASASSERQGLLCEPVAGRCELLHVHCPIASKGGTAANVVEALLVGYASFTGCEGAVLHRRRCVQQLGQSLTADEI